MKIALILFYLGISSLCFSQGENRMFMSEKFSLAAQSSRIEKDINGDTILISEYISNDYRTNARNKIETKYKGTPFLHNGWYKGQVWINSSSPVSVMMAYDLVKQSVLVVRNLNENAVAVKPTMFEINGLRFLQFFKVYKNAGTAFYQKILDGPIPLFKEHACFYKAKVQGEKTGYEQSGDGFEGYFEKSAKYYYLHEDTIKELRKGVKPIMTDRLKEYIKEHKPDLKSEKDLIAMFTFINQGPGL